MPLLMTEKDAVKCADFAQENYWYLPVDAVFSTNISADAITQVIDEIAALTGK